MSTLKSQKPEKKPEKVFHRLSTGFQQLIHLFAYGVAGFPQCHKVFHNIPILHHGVIHNHWG